MKEVGKLGAGATVGGIIGGILGGVKGTIAGILVGGGGVAAATLAAKRKWRRARCCACAWINAPDRLRAGEPVSPKRRSRAGRSRISLRSTP